MIPVVTPAQMSAIDAAAPEPVSVLVARAGSAVARAAVRMLGGTYGRRVVVVAGTGNNGADGRVAAERLRARGVRVVVLDAASAPARLPEADLVVDAAFGTGLSRPYVAPDPGGALVLAVDIPSGVDGRTGQVLGRPMAAHRTVTFAALKPGLVFEPGRSLCGAVEVADIGLDVSSAAVHVVEDADVAGWIPRRSAAAHKWRQSVLVIAGSPAMRGAAHLVTSAAQRAGAGMVRLAVPGVSDDPARPVEAVGVDVPDTAWADDLATLGRSGAVAVGPGLGTSPVARHQIRRFVSQADVPLVIDGDALTALGTDAVALLAERRAPAVLTPHDGELERLIGRPPGDDRVAEACDLAAATRTVVVLKGPTTVVAAPGRPARIVTSGDERLATAGTGDVLTGIMAAFLAAGIGPHDAATAAAHVHGRAGALGPRPGTVASDVAAAVPEAIAQVIGSPTAAGVRAAARTRS